MKTWQEEFDREYGCVFSELFHYDTGGNAAPMARKIKDFISQLLEKEREKLNRHERHDLILILQQYSKFLEKKGYMDTDWYVEEPNAIDRFLEENNR